MRLVASIIFSKDRALLLRATLESFRDNFMDHLEFVDTYVIYKCSNEVYEKQYAQLKEEFPFVNFIKESSLILHVRSLLSRYKYVFFQVDDNIVNNVCFVEDALKCLETPKVLGFSYRLGKNITYCYMADCPQRLPSFNSCWSPQIQIYIWKEEEHDFGYPLELSSTIYRSEDILQYAAGDITVNSFENTLNSHKFDFAKNRPFLCCYDFSRMFSLPSNNVANTPGNRVGTLRYYTEEELASIFDAGKRIKVENFYGIRTTSPHQEFPITFEEIK